MLQQAATDDKEVLEGVDERLAQLRVAPERSDAELAARDRQREFPALLRGKRERDLRWKRGDLRAGDAVGARLIIVGLDVGRNLSVDSLNKSTVRMLSARQNRRMYLGVGFGKHDVTGTAVEDENTRLL